MQHAGKAVAVLRHPHPHPQQQSSQGNGPPQQGLVFSMHEKGVQHCKTIMLQMVQGAGMRAMSLPPTETTKMSCSRMFDLMNLSCARRLQQALPFSVVASTAVLMVW
tara:strand:+ start:528 stop:848 length:321 start_codon:yes stop_codon:yes gene_type:complete